MAGFSDFKDFILWIAGLLNLVIPVAASAAILVFIWGLAKFIYSSGDPKGNKAGQNLMIWGVLALFIMVSYMGIIHIMQSTLGVPQGSVIPTIHSS